MAIRGLAAGSGWGALQHAWLVHGAERVVGWIPGLGASCLHASSRHQGAGGRSEFGVRGLGDVPMPVLRGLCATYTPSGHMHQHVLGHCTLWSKFSMNVTPLKHLTPAVRGWHPGKFPKEDPLYAARSSTGGRHAVCGVGPQHVPDAPEVLATGYSM
jgi:hypothetical protein